MDAKALIAAQLAKPFTHRVTTYFEGGKVYRHATRSAAQAENWAIGERRKIGRDLINRETGDKVRVIAVTIDLI
jgi:hypothetical protein